MTADEGQRSVDEEQVKEIAQLIRDNPNATVQPMQLIVMPTTFGPTELSIPDITDANKTLRYELAVSGGQHRLLASAVVRKESEFFKNHKHLVSHDAQVFYLLHCFAWFLRITNLSYFHSYKSAIFPPVKI